MTKEATTKGRYLIDGTCEVYTEIDLGDLKLRRAVGHVRIELYYALWQVYHFYGCEHPWDVDVEWLPTEDPDYPHTIRFAAHSVIGDVTKAEATEVAGGVDAVLEEVVFEGGGLDKLQGGGACKPATVEPDRATEEGEE